MEKENNRKKLLQKIEDLTVKYNNLHESATQAVAYNFTLSAERTQLQRDKDRLLEKIKILEAENKRLADRLHDLEAPDSN